MFAPDYRAGVAYQSLLAEALWQRGIEVEFLSTYRRGFPLARQAPQKRAEVLHLHWPEAYFQVSGGWQDKLRQFRFPTDLRLARRSKALVSTAHNLYPHNLAETALGQRAEGSAYRQAERVIAHSAAAKRELQSLYGVAAERIAVIPHGDLAGSKPEPLPERDAARRRLGLPERGVVLTMFGRVEPYKGIEEVVDAWRAAGPSAGVLVVAGEPGTAEAARLIELRRAGAEHIRFEPRRLSEEELRTLLAASSCVVFNYRRILTSGAANLARSLGVPLCLPQNLTSVDLAEPDERVFRFAALSQLAEIGRRGEELGADFEAAERFRKSCSWDEIAARTIEVYRAAWEARMAAGRDRGPAAR